MHADSHPLAGQTVVLNERASDPVRGIVTAGAEFSVEDYWDRLGGGSWMTAAGNLACLQVSA